MKRVFAVCGLVAASCVNAQTLVEYANRGDFPNAPLGNFFYTANAAEQAQLDSGQFGRFYRTGASFSVAGAQPVCRFYGSVKPGPNSHFYTANADECAALRQQQISPVPTSTQQWNYEGTSFNVTLPNAAKACPSGTRPVYRLYNQAFGAAGKQAYDSNHRYTTRAAEVFSLKAKGWKDEGLVFCAQLTDTTYPTADSVANQCVSVRKDPAYGDKPGTLAAEKSWVRSFSDEKYLWYDEIPRLPLAWYETPVAVFNDARTPFLTASGKAKDQFHYNMPTAEYEAESAGESSATYGMQLLALRNTPPRNFVVAFIEPGSPAALAGVQRGDRLITIDNLDLVNGNQVNALNAALFPSQPGTPYRFGLQSASGELREVVMAASAFQENAVQVVKTLSTATGAVGYLHFSAFLLPTEGALVNAFTQLKAANVKDLVLDLRYNGGGLLYLSAQVGYMIAGNASSGKVFYRPSYNDKRTSETNDPDNPEPFYNITSGFDGTGTTANKPLPSLNLKRLYVLTSDNTASASEAVINGLRGIDVEVVLIGETTTGKPYGFLPTDNCSTTYFTVEFKGTNNKGFGDYADGFAPNCTVADDLTNALGSPNEALLAAALKHRSTGSCPAGTATHELGKRLPSTSASLLGLSVAKQVLQMRR
jgi:carboxyl-terminal processing protease